MFVFLELGLGRAMRSKAMRNYFFYAITSYTEFQKSGIPDDGNLT